MGRELAKQVATKPNDEGTPCANARSGYYAAMTDLERVESNLRRRITRREWSTFCGLRSVEVFT